MRLQPYLLFIVVLLAGCSGGGGGAGGGNRDVEIAWTANRETAVNAAGGGYRVYYAGASGFDPAAATMIDVPYQGASSAPTSIVLNLPSGTHYIKVTAYSALNPAGSSPSAESEVIVP